MQRLDNMGVVGYVPTPLPEFPGSGTFYYIVPPRNVEIIHFQEFLLSVPPRNLKSYLDAGL